jgi:hypothetical protein
MDPLGFTLRVFYVSFFFRAVVELDVGEKRRAWRGVPL